MKKLSDIANEIADQLQNRAFVEKRIRDTKSQAEYEGYYQACEDFAKALRMEELLQKNEKLQRPEEE